jgi:hypothetical protein
VTLPLTKIISSFERKLALAEGHGEAPVADKSPKKKREGIFTRPVRHDEMNDGIDVTDVSTGEKNARSSDV